MRSTSIFKSLAFVAAVNAVEFTNTEYDIHALTPFNITWAGNISPVTIFLMNGPSSDLQTVNTIVSGAKGNSFVWLPSISLPDEVYTLQIDDDGISDPNFSPQFQFQGGAANPSSTSTSGSATVTSASSGTTDGTALPSITSSGSSNATITTGSVTTQTTKTASSSTKTSATGSSSSAVQSGAITGNGAAYLASPTGLMMLAGGALALLA